MDNEIVSVSPDCGMLEFLQGSGLLVSDIDSTSALFFYGVKNDKGLSGVVGLQVLGTQALIRSLAVRPELRGSGLGRTLVKFAEQKAEEKGIASLYLLTTDAASFFAKNGCQANDGQVIPDVIQKTAQFSHLCPASSTLMSKQL